MGILSAVQKVGLLVAVGAVSVSLHVAAQDGYDPEYDDETAAGRIETAAQPEAATEDGGGVSADATGASDGYDDESVGATDESESSEVRDGDNLAPWAWGGPRAFSSLTGPVGLFNVYDAGSGDAGTFGLGIHGGFFKYSDYLFHGDENTNMWGGVNLRITPIKYLEIFAGLEASSNSNTMATPQLIQTLGEFNIGLKGMYSPVEMLDLGLIFGLEFQNPVGEVGVSFDGLTFPLGLLTSVDFSKLNAKVPLKAHFNAIYRFDNSNNLIDEVEQERGGCGTDVDGDGVPDYGGCLDPAERKGLDIDRTDQMRIALGVEASLPYVTPLIEYGIDIPVNRQDFVCPLPPTASRPDSCMSQEGGAGMRQVLTIGVRVLPPVPSLSVDLGVDIGLAGYAPSVHELSPQAPYRVLFGLTYSFDPFARVAEPVEAEPCPTDLAPPPILPQPVIAGYVHDSSNPNTPVPGASVAYAGLNMNPQLTDANGKFDSYPMPTGPVTVTVRAHGYEEATFTVEIPDPALATSIDANMPAGSESTPMVVSLDCPLVEKSETGAAQIVVTDPNGPVADALVEVSGPLSLSGATNSVGEIRLEGEAGQYGVRVSKTGYFDRERVVEITVNGDARLEVALTPVPSESSVEVGKERINIKKRVMFNSGSDEVAPQSRQLLDEVVAALRSRPDITKVEIQGHTDNRGGRKKNLELSTRRAEAVMAYLVSEGISSERLTAKGFGPSKPRAPNLTSSGRAKNRRVEFHIRGRAN